MYTTWKWSKGETYYKSARKCNNDSFDENNNPSYNSQENAINQSLAENSFFNNDAELMNITNSVFSRHQNMNGTRREDIDNKMSERETIAQRGINPFLNTSYVNDIVAHDMYLKPVNTTFERLKNTENNNNDKYNCENDR